MVLPMGFGKAQLFSPELLEEMKNYTQGPEHHDAVDAFAYSLEAIIDMNYKYSWIHRACNWCRNRFPNGSLLQL